MWSTEDVDYPQVVAMVAVDDLGGEHHVPGGGIDLGLPRTIAEAFNGPDAEKWREAVYEEMQSIDEANTLSAPVNLPCGMKVTNLKFILLRRWGRMGLLADLRQDWYMTTEERVMKMRITILQLLTRYL
jgi:hypothetical protein